MPQQVRHDNPFRSKLRGMQHGEIHSFLAFITSYLSGNRLIICPDSFSIFTRNGAIGLLWSLNGSLYNFPDLLIFTQTRGEMHSGAPCTAELLFFISIKSITRFHQYAT